MDEVLKPFHLSHLWTLLTLPAMGVNVKAPSWVPKTHDVARARNHTGTYWYFGTMTLQSPVKCSHVHETSSISVSPAAASSQDHHSQILMDLMPRHTPSPLATGTSSSLFNSLPQADTNSQDARELLKVSSYGMALPMSGVEAEVAPHALIWWWGEELGC
jgi:hypothetical protein